jgi:1,4-dihydroxy-2-naphthoate octaprenyltransferase
MTDTAALPNPSLARTARDWLKASRLASQSYIALPLLLGQLVYARTNGGSLHLGVLALVQLFGLFDQLYIVYANDVADQATDRLNTTSTLFSGGSRVLVEDRLSAGTLGSAARAAAAALVAISLALALWRGAPLLVLFAFVAIGLLWAYSYPPFRLSYRGGGELLQTFGVGMVLPLYGYVAQGGSFASFPFALLALLLPTHLGCAIATALPDEPSDRQSNKLTLAARIGGERAALVTVALNLVALALAPFALEPLGLHVGVIFAVPGLTTLVVLLARPAPPGSRRLVVRVAAAIMCTLSLVGAVALGLAPS